MMNRRAFLSVTLFHFSAAVLFFGASLPTRAQGPGGLFGGQMGEMIGKMRQSRAFADPGISNTANLLTRPDVTNELVLNGRQTEALAELQSGYPAAMMQQMQTTFAKVFQDQGAVNFQEMSAEERQDFGLKMRDKAQEAMFTVQAEQDKKSEVGLAPSQLKRLHELDLQWRGPLALTDAKFNEKFSLTADQVAKLSIILKEYRQAQEDARMAMFSGRSGQQRPGAGGIGTGQPPAGGANPATGAPPPAKGAGPPAAGRTPAAPGANPPGGGFGNFRMPSLEEMQMQMTEADKQILKLRKTTDGKALALLTPEQLQMWKTVQGKPFTFRVNL